MVMGTLVSGMGPANLSYMMAFLNLPHSRTFLGQVFKNIDQNIIQEYRSEYVIFLMKNMTETIRYYTLPLHMMPYK